MNGNSVVRFCFVRLTTQAQGLRDELVGELSRELAAACAPCPVWVGVPGDSSAARWDVAITIGLPGLEAWQALERRADFIGAMTRLTDRAEVLKAWTFAQP